MRATRILLGGFVGLIVGYFGGAYVACTWLVPTSNLCGVYGVFLTGPIGLILGLVVAWRMSRRAPGV
jgi:hypothetical protein